MNEAYQKSHSKNDQNNWVSRKKRLSPQLLYWRTVMELQIIILPHVHRLFRKDFSLDVHNGKYQLCSLWLPIFIHDLKLLQSNHPGVYKEFCQGKFTINKSGKPFSRLVIDQAHEQNNRLDKIDGSANHLLNDNAALLKWTVADPAITEMVQSFRCNDNEDTEISHYHETLMHSKCSFVKM